jgi:hypothetical protein
MVGQGPRMALRLLGGVLRRHDRGEAAGDLSDPWDHDDVYWDAENDRVARESKAMTWETVESSAVGCQSAASEALSSEGGQDPPPQPPHRPHCGSRQQGRWELQKALAKNAAASYPWEHREDRGSRVARVPVERVYPGESSLDRDELGSRVTLVGEE